MPTYHPAYLLRNQALSEKRRVWEDMLAVMEKIGAPTSEKQEIFSKTVRAARQRRAADCPPCQAWHRMPL